MDKPSLSRDHNGKCANSKEKYFSHSIDTAGLKLLIQIGPVIIPINGVQEMFGRKVIVLVKPMPVTVKSPNK